ncbi:MAG TPA: HAD family hydrolase [Terriglobia bacterium]|nr:HAD family hydrolase [Terriglobia bacterium]
MLAPFDLIALDADDTLWHNEPKFYATQEQFRSLLTGYHTPAWIDERLHETEKRNLAHFGYGVKGFVLSMIETAVELTEGRISGQEVQQIINLGHSMLTAPVELIDGVREAVEQLSRDYPLALLTKGDLFDQETKLARSRLGELFSHVEIVSEKNAVTYSAVMKRRGVEPSRFLMVGNSLRSDVLPVLEAGGAAVHVPYPLTWVHEDVPEDALAGKHFACLTHIRELSAWLAIQASQ